MGLKGMLDNSYLHCCDHEHGWGNRTYFTWFSEFRPLTSASHVPVAAAVESGVLVVVFVLSSLTNGAVFYTLCSNRRLRTVTNYLVCNLTLADGCFTLCCPLVAVVRVTGSWTLGSFACKTVVYLSMVCGFVTIWTLTLISIDRYMCIVRSGKRRITPALVLLLIALVWVLTLAAFTPLLLYFVVKDCPYGHGLVSICTLSWPRTPSLLVSVVFTSIVCGLGFVVPVIILILSHAAIFFKVRKIQVALTNHRQRRFSTSDIALLTSQSVWSHQPPKLNVTVSSAGLKSKWQLTAQTQAVADRELQWRHGPGRLDLLLDTAAALRVNIYNTLTPAPLLHRAPSPFLTVLSVKNSSSLAFSDPAPGDFRSPEAAVVPTSPACIDKISPDSRNRYGFYPKIDFPLYTRSSLLPAMQLGPGEDCTPQTRTRRRTISTVSAYSRGLGLQGHANGGFHSQRQKGRDMRVVKTLLVLVLLFLVMWAPIFVVLALLVTDGQREVTGSVSSSAFLATACLAYCSAVLNPLAYGLSTEKLRSYLHAALLCCCSEKRPSSKGPLPARVAPQHSQCGSDAVCGPDTSCITVNASRPGSRRKRGVDGHRLGIKSLLPSDDQQSCALPQDVD